MSVQEIMKYKRYQVQECQERVDLDMINEFLSNIPYSKEKEEMVSAIAKCAVVILSEYNWLDPLYDTLEEDRRRELEEDDGFGILSDMQYEAAAEDRVIGA